MEEEEFSPFGGYSSGCELHGEDFLRECTMCGIEFCSACFPQSALCPDCAAQTEIDAEASKLPERYELTDLSGKQLKALCKKHGLEATGNKFDLIDRLEKSGLDDKPKKTKK